MVALKKQPDIHAMNFDKRGVMRHHNPPGTFAHWFPDATGSAARTIRINGKPIAFTNVVSVKGPLFVSIYSTSGGLLPSRHRNAHGHFFDSRDFIALRQ
jgi:hypothetical protein